MIAGKKTMDQRVNGITIAVSDLAVSRKFYESLGWRPSSASNGSISFFALNGVVLSLYPIESFRADTEIAVAKPSASVSFAYSVREKREVDTVLAQAATARAKKVHPAKDREWGGRSGYFLDPDGYLWEVLWNPHFPLDQNHHSTVPE